MFLWKSYPQLETNRLLLRQIHPDDAAAIFQVYGDSKVAELDDFDVLEELSEAIEAIEWFERELADRRRIRWGIVRKADGVVMGTCWLGFFEWQARRAEVGFELAPAFWKQGYATEALDAVLDFAFQTAELNRVEATVTFENVASVRVLQKLNFVQEGIGKEREFYGGVFHDSIHFALLKRDREEYLQGA